MDPITKRLGTRINQLVNLWHRSGLPFGWQLSFLLHFSLNELLFKYVTFLYRLWFFFVPLRIWETYVQSYYVVRTRYIKYKHIKHSSYVRIIKFLTCAIHSWCAQERHSLSPPSLLHRAANSPLRNEFPFWIVRKLVWSKTWKIVWWMLNLVSSVNVLIITQITNLTSSVIIRRLMCTCGVFFHR